MTDPIVAPFRARARILALLGDQLIGTDQLAIFELVKNAYDADAGSVTVTLAGVDGDDPTIDVIDTGDGMDMETITSIWLEPASDHREIQRLEKRRTKLFNRLPLGEKGVGRFAVHKLGHRIELLTRPRGENVEHQVLLDWDELTNVRYLDQTSVTVHTREPEFFTEKNGRKPHGTLISIRKLRNRVWRRGEARQLYRSITAISSPFDSSDGFSAELSIPEHPEWLEGMPDVQALVELAPWHFEFTFDGTLNWSYEFRSPIGRRLEGRRLSGESDPLLLEKESGDRSSPVADVQTLDGIGPISGQLVAYDRDRKILTLLPQNLLVKQFLDQQGGVRVYRDGVRVYNYGEPGDDWLHLDLRRVNRPSQRLSRNIVIGAINLNLETSTRLREKTNREGFDETETFKRFRGIVTAVIHRFEVERALDKDRLKRLLEDAADKDEILVETPLRRLREAVAASADARTILPLVDRVEKEYVEMRDMLLRAGMSGLNLAIVIHEVEKGVRSIHEAVRSKASPELLEQQSRGLMGLIESVGGLLKEKTRDGVDIRELVQSNAEINVRRYRRHQVKVTYDLPEGMPKIRIPGSSALLQNVLVNLVDNAIYWLRVRWPDQGPDEPQVRRIHIALTDDLPGGPALIVADNGPGFQDLPEIVTKPFFTRRPDGMGLGLYYSSLAMSLASGSLLFPEREDLELPDWVDGAVVAMQFGQVIK
ncbi:ATP-binding protein [Mesorhizobium sp. M0051]|uniref:ATP-binding protein n=1 Tax=Mesorhizobium TaxID=68287 RepID=UPI003339BCD1